MHCYCEGDSPKQSKAPLIPFPKGGRQTAPLFTSPNPSERGEQTSSIRKVREGNRRSTLPPFGGTEGDFIMRNPTPPLSEGTGGRLIPGLLRSARNDGSAKIMHNQTNQSSDKKVESNIMEATVEIAVMETQLGGTEEKQLYFVEEVFDRIDNKFIDFYGEYGRKIVNERRDEWNKNKNFNELWQHL